MSSTWSGGSGSPASSTSTTRPTAVAWGDEPGQASERTLALRGHLVAHWAAPTVLVGEAPGQDGARWTGVPFTSCRQLCGSGPTEATATVVRRVLAELGKEDEVLLWNASMLFAPGNRDPRRAEVDACGPVLDLVCRGRTVFAVGRFAQAATGAPYIRHPSHGGAARFADGLRVALRSPGPTSGALAGRRPARTGGPGGDVCDGSRPYTGDVYYGHGSWIALVVFAGLFALRMLSPSVDADGRPGSPGPRSSFTAGNRAWRPRGSAGRVAGGHGPVDHRDGSRVVRRPLLQARPAVLVGERMDRARHRRRITRDRSAAS